MSPSQSYKNPTPAWGANSPPLEGLGEATFVETLWQQNAFTGGFATPYKFNAKELDLETGNYYYGARYYNPQVSVWFGVDPLHVRDPQITPYHFVKNNPILLIDPNGLTWVNPEDEIIAERLSRGLQRRAVQLEKLSDKLDKKAQRAFEKGKIEKAWDLEERAAFACAGADDLRKGQTELYYMGKVDTKFTFQSSTLDGGITYMNEDGIIVLAANSDADIIHEAVHGFQHLTGDAEFVVGGSHYADLGDEQRAYQRQFNFDPGSVKNLGTRIENFMDITKEWVSQLRDTKGKPIYENRGYEDLRKK